MLCRPPSPRGCPFRICLPLLPQEGCLSTQCSLQAENTGMQSSSVTLALGVWTWSGMAQGITPLACQPLAHPPAGSEGEKQARVQAAGWKQPAPSSNLASGGRKGHGRDGQTWKEEEAVVPSCSPEYRCYIYLTAGLGFGVLPVTQALQPARIREDGTFLSKNNPPAACERAGVEVTDWTAAPTTPLTGSRRLALTDPGMGMWHTWTPHQTPAQVDGGSGGSHSGAAGIKHGHGAANCGPKIRP